MDKVSPERKLCRITSSWRPGLEKFQKEIDKFHIVKLSDAVSRWTLILVNDDNEESEKTEESSSEEELFDFNLPTKNTDQKNINTEAGKLEKSKEAISEGVKRERNHYNRPNLYRNKNNNRYYGRGRRNNNKTSMNYKGRSNREEIYSRGSRDYKSRTSQDFSLPGNQNQELTPPPNRDRDIHSTYKRGFNFINDRNFRSAPKQDNLTTDHRAIYNAERYQHSLQHPSTETSPSPWIHPPILVQNYSLTSVPHVLPENPRNGVGLLGDSPYASSVPVFQPNNQNDNYSYEQNSTFTPMPSNFQPDAENDNFICDQTSAYPPITSDNDNNSFAHNQSAPYSSVTSNYPSNKQTNKFDHDKDYWNNSYGNYSKSNQPRNKHYNNNNQKRNSWNKNSRRQRPNVRNNSSFDYRN